MDSKNGELHLDSVGLVCWSEEGSRESVFCSLSESLGSAREVLSLDCPPSSSAFSASGSICDSVGALVSGSVDGLVGGLVGLS